ncbi:hypothetical protein GCM10009575_048490 [Streptomyces rhizosphaericus]|uniref:Uncharacterized protein n=1 Tax=Streptomyces rhizosphaericus TaxID=114699 RepID=A0ABN1Q304_9ACTN
MATGSAHFSTAASEERPGTRSSRSAAWSSIAIISWIQPMSLELKVPDIACPLGARVAGCRAADVDGVSSDGFPPPSPHPAASSDTSTATDAARRAAVAAAMSTPLVTRVRGCGRSPPSRGSAHRQGGAALPGCAFSRSVRDGRRGHT